MTKRRSFPDPSERVIEARQGPASISAQGGERLNKLIRNSGDIIAIIDERGIERFVSDSVERITGYTPEEVLGTSCFAYLHPGDRKRIQRDFEQLLCTPGGAYRADYRHRTKSGEWVHLEAIGTNFLDDHDIRGIVLNIRDITEHKLVEDSLRRSKDHLDKLLRNSSDILMIMDIDGRELYISEAIEGITGYAAGELIGTVSFDHIHPDDLERVKAKVAAVLQEPEKPQRVEFRRRKKGGGWVHLEAAGMNLLEDPDIRGLVINARDITDRKEKEAALRKNLGMLDKLIRNSSDLLVILEPDGTEKYMSHSLLRLTGYSPDEVVGTVCFDHFHPDDLPRVEKVRQALLERPGEPQRIEYRRRTRSGDWIILEAICSNLLDDPDIQGIVVNARDITERKLAERRLSSSRARYRQLARLLPEAVWEADLEGRLRFLNQKGMELLGYTQEDIDSGVNGFELFAPPGREACIERTAAVLHGAETEITEYEMLRKDGSTFPALVHSDLVREEGRPAYFIGIGIDITERKESEQEMSHLAAAIEQSGETIMITDTEGLIRYVNPYFEHVSGYRRREVIGRNAGILKSGEQSSGFYRSMWGALGKGETWQGRFINRRKDGTLYYEEATISPVFDRSGVIAGYVAVKRDVTEQLRITREKEDLEQRFHQAQKMESVGLLAGGVAHDLNNLLTPILGYGEMLLAGSVRARVRREYAKGIVQAGRGARDIVNQLLAFSRKQALEIKPVDLNQLVTRFERLLRRMIPEDISISINTCKDLPLIMGDINQLEQVVMNLAVNARDAMPSGGSLGIETGVFELDEKEAGANEELKPGIFASMTIRDTGFGMDDRTREQIFEPFFSTKPRHKGSGLGLATVYGIIRQHGGDIRVQSRPMAGSSFQVLLPAAGCQTSPDESSEIKNPALKGSETILLVEDDERVREMSLYFLKRKGYKVIPAEDGEQALALAGESGNSIDLLLTDVVLPGINGKDLYDLISAYQPEMEVIYMSGYTGEVLKSRGVMDKSINFIQKPFSVESLASKIREVLGNKARGGNIKPAGQGSPARCLYSRFSPCEGCRFAAKTGGLSGLSQ